MSNGYLVVDYDGSGMLEIEKDDESNRFETDDDAVDQAIADGVKIIPVAELPDGFPYYWLGWIDTPENRKAIAEYAEKLKGEI